MLLLFWFGFSVGETDAQASCVLSALPQSYAFSLGVVRLLS